MKYPPTPKMRKYLEALLEGRDPFADCRNSSGVCGVTRTGNSLRSRLLVVGPGRGQLTEKGRALALELKGAPQ